MSEELKLVTELAIILVAAGVFTVISKALKQPLILGYIVAGFLVGPHLGLFPQFSPESVHQWSELGIIFMLFSLGLEFSFKKLLKIGSSAFITAGTKCVGMMIVGLIVGPMMHWTMMESIFLGGLLSMSSTTIIIKAYDEMGLKDKPHASLLFGSLVFEDLIAVLLMVLLSTMAVSNKFEGGQMLMAFGKLAFFLVLCFVIGIYVLPTILKKAKPYLNDEILLLTSIGLCFAMVVLANKMEFSSALGAFIMGCILSETVEGEHIEHLTSNIKDLFGAIFFVSVGMLVDPAVIAAHWGTILVITLVAMGGILIFSTSGVLLAGENLTNAVRTGFSLMQLGEFAFIIAAVGTSLGVMRDFIYPVIIAVSVITTFTTPYMIKAAEPALRLIRRKAPRKFIDRFDKTTGNDEARSLAEKSEWKVFFKNYFTRVGLYSILLVAILLASSAFLDTLADKLLSSWSPLLQNITVTAVTLFVMSPFLYGLAVTTGSISKPAAKLLKEKESNKWPILALTLLRIVLAIIFIILAFEDHFDLNGWALLLIIASAFLFIIVAKNSVHKMSALEKKFLQNYNEKEELQRKATPVASSVKEMMQGYDVHIESVSISGDFTYAGKTLRDMPFRHSSGVNIVKITRGSRVILIPSGDELILPGDNILAVGTTQQLSAFKRCVSDNTCTSDTPSEEFALEVISLSEDNALVGKSLREADLRRSGCMVISILKGEKLLTNPGPETVFEAGDSIWLAGEKSSVQWYK